MTCDLLKLASKGVQGLRPYQPGKPIEELEREYGIENAIKLASNENPLGPSPHAIHALHRHLTGLSRYPDANGFTLKKALAKKFNINIDMITLGNGSNDVLELVARAFITPAHSVIFSEYAFIVYPIVAQAIGAKIIIPPAKEWGHDLTAIQAAIREDTRLIFIANPNNPTGTWVDKTSLRHFLNAVPENVLVVLDEAYFEYVEKPNYPNGLAWLADFPNLIVTRTFSKIYGLAGLRVGYAVSHPDIADLLNRVRQPFNVNRSALLAAEIALDDTEHLEKTIAVNRAGMAQLTQAFEAMNLPYIPSIGNFVTVEVGQVAEIYEKLLRQGVIVRPIANYGMPRHLRITIGTEDENTRFIEALKNIVE